uniref:Polysaccharide deacetylase n=1 Tax=uncultured bacterium A1Q1_fos_1246 TaxID=1256545 RepID=L7VUD7_9BACT|nr:polysaccharide deacetylase [uncultured bacterium A1Q1_fos_1246]
MRQLIPILLYHSIAETVAPDYRRWAVTPTAFAAQLAYLRQEGYHALTVTQLAHGLTMSPATLPTKPVVITFDDGLADFYTGALPLLQDYGFPATLYITTGYVEGKSRWLAAVGEGERAMMSWAQIAELPADAIECGAHTHSHPQLDTLPRRQAHYEVNHSKQLLEEKLGRRVTSFAYPHGYHDKAVQQMVQAAGFTAACGVKDAISRPDDDRFGLARLIVAGDTTLPQFANLLAGRGVALAPRYERPATTVWRLVRQWQAHRRQRNEQLPMQPKGATLSPILW